MENVPGSTTGGAAVHADCEDMHCPCMEVQDGHKVSGTVAVGGVECMWGSRPVDCHL
jgi:hypothetical protein